MVASLHALGQVATASDADDSVTVTLNLADAFGVGHSLVALTHNPLVKMPDATKEIYRRVGRQIVSASKAEMAQRIAKAAESAAKVGAR